MPSLEALGWSAAREAAFAAERVARRTPGRVVAVHRTVLEVATESGPVLAGIAGRLRHTAASPLDLPVAGDFVSVGAPDGDGRATVHAVLPRTALLARRAPGDRAGPPIQPLAANAGLVLVVTACDRDRLARRAERLLAMAWDSGGVPIWVLTKADLAEDPAAARREAELASPGVDVIAASVRTGLGIEEIRARLAPGVTGALLGASGAGKSSLVNRLAGREVLDTGDVRVEDHRGRHTTTHRELVALEGGGLLLDGPGLREAAAAESGDGMGEVFAEIESLAGACRFRDCAHASEPGCAVRAALADGSLDAGRHGAWERMRREAAYLERRDDPRLLAAARELWKARSREGVANMHRKRRPHM
jgi:ribosome biogenesis GTPase